ncbi:MAG: hypothetical protein DMG14_32110 [Acidobacteria bacterium]|nr:MAG: hypothetical protein DMG14_32110 [Acidobacteriota bacterium]
MLRSVARSLAAGLVWTVAVMPLLAHHEILAKFDSAKPQTLKGSVTRVDWASPHVHVLVNVPDRARLVNWAVELESPLDLERSGWNRNSLKPGDAVTIQGIRARDGSLQVWGNSITLTNTGEKVLAMSALTSLKPAPSNQPAKPTPRWPDGKPRLGAAPGETGYWAKPSSTSLMETGAVVATDGNALLKNIKDIDKVAPFQKWARDLYEYRQRNFLKDDPMFLYCKPPGAVRQFQMPYGNQFLEDKAFGRIFVMAGGGNHDWHFIYTDGRPQQGDLRGNDTNPLYYGNARGRWEGDTFVVDTKGLNEKFWISNGGLPHTEQIHAIERFTRTDMNTMKYEVTIDDPGAYTRSWSASWTLQWVAGEELPISYCQDNRP